MKQQSTVLSTVLFFAKKYGLLRGLYLLFFTLVAIMIMNKYGEVYPCVRKNISCC